MSKYEKQLRDATGGNAEALIDLAIDEAEERGFATAVKEMSCESLNEPQAKEMRRRYEYLKHGGEWQCLSDLKEPYLAGYLDAMATLGVMP